MENNNKQLQIYIDESGSMGLEINRPYFIICALILENSQMKPIKNVVKRISEEIFYKRELKELHANDMSFEEKVMAFNYIKELDFYISYLIINKDNINQHFFQNKDIYFNYMIYLLLEKLFKKPDILHIYITIDNRNLKVTSVDSLQDYLNIELIKNDSYDKNIHVKYDDSENNRYLQIVDILANTVFAKYNFNKTYFYDQVSDKILHNVFYPEKFDMENNL